MCTGPSLHAQPSAAQRQTTSAIAPLILTEEERAWLKAHPVIRLGVDRSYAPYSIQDTQGSFSGAAADYVKVLETQLGIKFQLTTPRPWAEMLDAITQREIDVITPVALTPDRAKFLAFTEIYLKTPLVVMTRYDDYTLRSPDDLAFRTVALVKGYSSSQQVLSAQPQIRALFVSNPLEGLIAVATGQAEAYVGAIGVNIEVAHRNGISNLRIATAYDLKNGQRLGVRKDWPMLASILDKALAAIPEAEIVRIHDRWVTKQIPLDGSNQPMLSASEKLWLKENKRIRVGVSRSDEPMVSVDKDGVFAGIVPAYLNTIRLKTGMDIEFVPFNSHSELLPGLSSGLIDLASIQKRPSQQNDSFHISAPFQNMALAVFSQRDAGFIGSMADLSGKRVAVITDSALQTLLAKQNGIIPVTVQSSLGALQAIVDGQADASIMEVDVGTYLIEKYGLKKLYTAHVLSNDPISFSFAVRPDWTELVSILDKAIAATSPDEVSAIRRTSLAINNDTSISREELVLWGTTSLALALSFFLLQAYLGNKRLRKEIERRQLSERAARTSEQRFSVTFEQAAVGIALVSIDGAWLRVNRHLCDMLAYSEEELRHLRFQDITYPDDLDVDVARVNRLLSGDIDSYHLEKRYIRKDGQIVWGLLTVALVRDESNVPAYFISVIEDVTQRKRDEERIEFLAYRDALTGLPNRALIGDRVTLAMADAHRAGSRLALLFLDLDNFKMVNDTLGHLVGDALLIQVAERLKTCLRAGDTVGRQGGDEFLLLISDIPGDDASVAIAATADKIFEQLLMPFKIDGHELTALASIGIAIFPDDGHDFETLLRKADTAMYSAKASGRNAYYFFAEQMNLDAVWYDQVRNGLRNALGNGEFQLHYQPQIDLASNQIIGAEALLRWTHPTLGPISPGRFIPVAEDCGLIIEIGTWVLNEACQQATVWRDSGYGDLTVAVNLSAVQFKRGDLEKTVATALTRIGLDPGRLELELTESLLLHDTESVLDMMNKLKSLGVSLSIDDFGTGYSSLSYLTRFPVDKLKIDQSFVRDMLNNPDDDAIVHSIIGLALNLELRTIAEGIESAEQQDALLQMGCQLGQGFHIAHPMPPDAFMRFLSERVAPSLHPASGLPPLTSGKT